MNNKIAQHLPLNRIPRPPGGAAPGRLWLLLAALLALGGTGCYRATGFQRNPVAAEVIPATGGDNVAGIKTKGGQGDYYLGNDFIQVTIDGTVYNDPVRTPLAGAASGGSIVDAGYILLDTSFDRVSIPGNVMNRLTPVVNLDPNLPVVFDQYSIFNTSDLASITMTGRVLDSQNQFGQGAGPVPGVSVTHTLSLTLLDRFFSVSTTVTNNGGSTLPIRTIGDCLIQQGGGYAFNIPANFDSQGNALATQWGIQIPGSTFTPPNGQTLNTNPVDTSVQAPVVGLMDLEPGADTVDSHASVGFLPLDADQMLVAADPQDLLTVPNRPLFPQRLAVGSLPVASLGPGQSITFNRRLVIVGGTSTVVQMVNGAVVDISYADQGTGLFNLLDLYRYTDPSVAATQDVGILVFSLSGNAQRQGPLPTEVRIERNVLAGTPDAQSTAESWQVQRVEWFEPNENLESISTLAPSNMLVVLPVGLYRMVLTNQNTTQVRTLFNNTNPVPNAGNYTQVGLASPLWIQHAQTFNVDLNDILCPGAAPDPNQSGPITTNAQSVHYFETTEANGVADNLQPLRITFVDAANNPVSMRRQRTLASMWNPNASLPMVAPGVIPGEYQFRGGSEIFGTGFTRLLPAEFAWFPNNADYTAYGTRGPLSDLVQMSFHAADGWTDIYHTLTVFPRGLPPGWTSFDLPGPGQATTGGYLTSEKLASAMANGVQVVGHTEEDLLVNGTYLWTLFRLEFLSPALTPYMIPASLSAVNRQWPNPYGNEPFVISGRSTTLPGYGAVTALFTPGATNAPRGGALVPQPGQTWILADFLEQGLGQYNVVHRPRAPLDNPQGDPPGLFTLLGAPQPGVPGNWWNQTGPYAFGLTNGSFDALELLRGASLAGAADPTAWFAEFLQVRTDWFNLLNVQSPTFFTKALGLSSAKFSLDTPVGLARTYLKTSPDFEYDQYGNYGLYGVLSALQSGAAVASTGPFLDVSVAGAGPGQMAVAGPVPSVTLAINLWMSDWMPVDQIRVVVNGVVQDNLTILNPSTTLAQSGEDTRLYTGTLQVPMPSNGKDAWIVVEAGVPLDQTGAYHQGEPWAITMRGIYPIAVTNPIFVKLTPGTTYIPPLP